MISIVRKAELCISLERAIARPFSPWQEGTCSVYTPPIVVITIPQSCRFTMRTDNFSQWAKHISVAICLRTSSFLNICSTNPFSFPSQKTARIISQPTYEYKRPLYICATPWYGRCDASRCAVACFRVPPFIRHALVSVPFGVAHSRPLAGTSLRSCARLLRNLRGFPPKRCAFLRRIWRPIKQASRLRSRLFISCRR